MPFEDGLERLDDLLASAYSVSLFTDWSTGTFHQVWRKRRTTDALGADAVAGLTAARQPVHPIRGLPPDACTTQLGRPGPWHERLVHFRADATPSAGDELQSEYLVARADASDAVRSVGALAAALAPLVLVSEVRSVAADDLWISPAYGRSSVAIHFTWRRDLPAVTAMLPAVEAALAPFDPDRIGRSWPRCAGAAPSPDCADWTRRATGSTPRERSATASSTRCAIERR